VPPKSLAAKLRRKSSDAEKIARARAASERARERLNAGQAQEVDIALRPLAWWRERWNDKATRRLFIETFIKIRNKFEGNRLVPFKLNAVQVHLHEHLGRKNAVLKARKQGVSRYFLVLNFADAVVNSGRRVRSVPHDPETEEEFFADLKTMYEELPDHIKPLTRYYSKELIWFHDPGKDTVDSIINTSTVQPGHEQKGRGQAITNLHLTEVPFWRGEAKKAATSLLEAAGEGFVAAESTAGGIEFFEGVYQQGKRGQGGWRSFFFEWWWNPNYAEAGARFAQSGRDTLLLKWRENLPAVGSPAYARALLTKREKAVARKIFKYLKSASLVTQTRTWRCDEVAERIAWRRSKVEELPEGENGFLVEYPENDRECFEATGRPVISPQYLKVTCQPSGPKEGREYAVGVDTSLGLQTGDPAALQVIDLATGQQVHSETLRARPDRQAERAAELSDLYNWATIVIERNNTGVAVIQKLNDLGYDSRLYCHFDAALRRKIDAGELSEEEARPFAQAGFPTTAENKSQIGIRLEEAVRKGWIGLSDPEWVEEAKHVFWMDNGTFAAESGHHDDRFMALGIVWYVMKHQVGSTGFVGVLPEVGDARF
jgi:hypothetical protein